MPANYDDDADVDDFLSHRGGGGDDSKGGFLSGKWKQEGKIDLWLYTKVAPKPLWRHGWQQIKVREDKDSGRKQKQIWSDPWNCHEPEAVLKNRERAENGDRKEPYVYCPACRFVEAMRVLVRDGKISWVEPIFRFEGENDDGDTDFVIHAGGCYNGFSKVERGTDAAKELKAAGIALSGKQGAYRERMDAKLNYLFLVVPHGKPDGIKVAIETEMLGRRVQRLIRKEREKNDLNGNPFKRPYCIRWTFDKSADPRDMYDADRMHEHELAPAVEKLIRSPTGPEISKLLAPGNAATLRARMEEYATKALHKALGKSGWDEIFDVQKREDLPAAEPERKPSRRDDGGEVRSDADPEPTTEKVKCEGPAKGPECSAMLLPWQEKCPKCGTRYDIDYDVKAEGVAFEKKVAAWEKRQEEAKKAAEAKRKPKDDDEDKPRRRAAKKDDEDEDKPRRRAAKKDDDEDKPRRRAAKKDDEDEDKPRRRAAKKDDDEDEKPRKRSNSDADEKPKKSAKRDDEDDDAEDDDEIPF